MERPVCEKRKEISFSCGGGLGGEIYSWVVRPDEKRLGSKPETTVLKWLPRAKTAEKRAGKGRLKLPGEAY